MSNSPIKIGYCLSLSGGLAANGQTARLAHQVWQERVNARGGLLGREVELICVDDQSDAATVAGIYQKLLSEDKVDLLLGGYGNNSITPAMPLVMENEKFLIGLMALGENIEFGYDQFFAGFLALVIILTTRGGLQEVGGRVRRRLEGRR